MTAPNLTQHPPRSPRVRLGGFAILPRILDKCRAALAGTQGAYNFNCPLDQRFFEFAGVEAEAFKAQVATGQGDGAMLAWVRTQSRTQPDDARIVAWSAFQDQRAPSELEGREFYQEVHRQIAPQREDVATWFELLDLDDYVSFGGQP